MTTPFFLIDFENVQPKALDRLAPGAARIKVFLGQHQSKLMLELVRALQPFGADAEYIQISGSGPDAVDFHIAFYIGRLAAAHPGAAFHIISKDKGFDPLVKHLAALGIACKRLPEIPAGSAAPTAVAASATDSAPAKKATRTAKKAPVKKAAVTVTVLPEANGPSPVATKAAARTPTIKPNVAKAATTGSPTTRAAAKVAQVKPAPGKVAAGNATTARARAAEVVALLRKSSKPARLAGLKSAIKSWFKPALDDAAVEAIVQSLQGSGRITVNGTSVTYALEAGK